MKHTRVGLFVMLLAGLVCLTGCSTITPKTSDLAKVHELYASEFTRLNVPAAEAATTAPVASPGDAFAQTLRAIRTYRTNYPEDVQELAHLQVLEGMIYLQSGRFGLASAVKDDVVAAGAKLASGTGRVVRDRLFAENFPALLEGWKETKKENNRSWRTFARVADNLAAAIDAIPAAQRPTVGDDEGGLYLATTAAIFYVWAHREIGMSPDRAEAPVKKAEWYAKAQRLIGEFLSEAEKKADAAQDVESEDAPVGHLRYVQWYHWLGQAR